MDHDLLLNISMLARTLREVLDDDTRTDAQRIAKTRRVLLRMESELLFAALTADQEA